MSLTIEDLNKIENLMKNLFGNRIELIEEKVTKLTLNLQNVKDIIVDIRGELNTEHEL